MRGERSVTEREVAEFCVAADFHCDQPLCHREILYKTLIRVIRPHLIPYLEHFFGIKELLYLARIVSVGENQLHHTIRMVELAASLPDEVMSFLGIKRDDLVMGVLFHDVGKGREVDDSVFDARSVSKGRVPQALRHYPGMRWVEWTTPFHDHVLLSHEIAKRYGLPENVLEAIALHHHVKIRPRALHLVGDALCLSMAVKEDIFNHHPEQYTAPGSNLAQVIAILDQLCAIERKYQARVGVGLEPHQIEDEVVRDLVTGMATAEDPRLRLLGVSLTGEESVVLFDLRAFGSFVKLHTEYEVQSLKASILQMIRSLVRVNRPGRERDLVALIGGDEYAVVTKVKDKRILDEMIERITLTVKKRTGIEMRYGLGVGGNIPSNFHQARIHAEMMRESHFLIIK